jgi:predicted RND superfamily exporter protein
MRAPPTDFDMPVVADPRDFDPDSGVWLERLVFNHRGAVLLCCGLATLVLAWHALQIGVNASFQSMVPRSHPFIRTLLAHPDALREHGNTLRVVIERRHGDVFDRRFLLTVKRVNDALYLLPGVDRSAMRGLWTPNLRWAEATEEGYVGGPVMPDRFDGSPVAMQALRANLARAAAGGRYVGDDARSTLILVPLLDTIQETGRPIDYGFFSRSLESQVRVLEDGDVSIRFIGFAKIAGDLIEGLTQIARWFAVSVAIAVLLVFASTRCWRSTLLLIFMALLAVVWLLGLMQWLEGTLDPYTVLVPFLVFAIGLSHGAQKMNGFLQDVGRGTHRVVAARYTFRRLFVPGLTALLANMAGFALLGLVDIPVLRDLALTATLGLSLLIVTKLILVPVGLSVVGVSPRAARRAASRRAGTTWVSARLAGMTGRRAAVLTLGIAAMLAGAAGVVRTRLAIGDLDPGAPELRQDARYNRDAGYLAAHYALSSDPFVILEQTPPGGCVDFAPLVEADRLGAMLRELPQVRGTDSAADAVRVATAGQFEGSPKWMSISRNPSLRGAAIGQVNDPRLVDPACSTLAVVAYLTDHRAQTLSAVVQASERFAAGHATPERRFLLAAGSAGIEAATNQVIARGVWQLQGALYVAVGLLCLATFRNPRAAVVALVPLVITSLLCEALMVLLGIGVKVATLPVIAVGVGVGVDYAIYLLGIQLALQRRGMPQALASVQALRFTGSMIGLIGLTLAAGVLTWAASPIRFQADMGVLLGCMLLWNVAGALFLVPALSHFLLADGRFADTGLMKKIRARVPR